jgi:hypothetical protein
MLRGVTHVMKIDNILYHKHIFILVDSGDTHTTSPMRARLIWDGAWHSLRLPRLHPIVGKPCPEWGQVLPVVHRPWMGQIRCGFFTTKLSHDIDMVLGVRSVIFNFSKMMMLFYTTMGATRCYGAYRRPIHTDHRSRIAMTTLGPGEPCSCLGSSGRPWRCPRSWWWLLSRHCPSSRSFDMLAYMTTFARLWRPR